MEKKLSEIENLSRLIVADAAFLTLREKNLFLKFLLNLKDENDDPISDEKSFEKRFLTLTLDDISLTVKRLFPRAKWNVTETLKKVKISKKIIAAQDIKSTCILDLDYPPLLRLISDPPFLLFYRGNLEILNRKCVSVVGTRRATQSALRATSDFSKSACDDGECVISGLAFGIDGAAHKGALLSKNPATAAILPSGIDTISPHSHTKLAQRILEKGGLIMSEYLPGTPAAQFRFVQRNRIVSALSPATVVIQAPVGSGAMITAALSLDYNREVFFHEECFSAQAKSLDEFAQNELKKLALEGKNIEFKMNNSPKRFVEDGAKIISSYEDFKKNLYGVDRN